MFGTATNIFQKMLPEVSFYSKVIVLCQKPQFLQKGILKKKKKCINGTKD